MIGNLYAPPSDGAAAVVHAASVPWSQEREAAAAINARWAPAATQGSRSGGVGGRLQGRAARSRLDLRFYARGLFASPAVTSWRGTPQDPSAGLLDRLRGALWGGTTIVASLLDFPLRRITGAPLAVISSQHAAATCVRPCLTTLLAMHLRCTTTAALHTKAVCLKRHSRGVEPTLQAAD